MSLTAHLVVDIPVAGTGMFVVPAGLLQSACREVMQVGVTAISESAAPSQQYEMHVGHFREPRSAEVSVLNCSLLCCFFVWVLVG